jgi:ribosomal protein S28E/S33
VPSLDDVEVAPAGATAADALSPSAINTLLLCPRQLAYARDPDTKGWRRPTPRTALGIVAHALTEAAATEDLADQSADRAAWLEARWELLVAEQADRLAAAWPGREVPPPRAWPGYAITKVRLVRHLTKSPPGKASKDHQRSDHTPAGPRATAAAFVPPLPWVERTLHSDHLFGTPDLVEEVDGKLRVVDLKAGVHQRETTRAQRRQLLLYAGLVQSALGRLPELCVIVDARGVETEFGVAQSDVDEALIEAESARAAFNGGVGVPEGPPARPSSENCRWCDYRVVCADYWRRRESGWPSTASDIIGMVTGAQPPYVQIDALDNGDSSRVILSADDGQAAVGDVVMIINAEKAGFETSRPRWNSHVRIIAGHD